MLAKERQKKIEKMLAEHGAVLVSELVSRFGVSIETVRRDLLTMEAEEKCVRVHGGAVVKGDMAPPRPFEERHRSMSEEKEALAAAASTFVHEGDVIGLDEGSTGIAFAKALAARFSRLTVVTHSLHVFEILRECKGFEVILLGGSYLDGANALVGDITVQTLRSLHLNAAFIFPSAISLDFGISGHNAALMQVQRAMLSSADAVFVLADSSKLEKKALYKLCEMNESYTFVTDAGLSGELQRLYTENGIKIVIGEKQNGTK
ncbi:MAG: DeoR/GlpR transcriptional regulator [Clostridia bacterium]|nr:DeoR/GlpR transcriptional regulator [Clostridia bacterium]